MSKPKTATWATWEDMPLDEFRARIAKAKEKAAELSDTLDELFPGLKTLTAEQRRHAPRLRDGEHTAFGSVLDVVDLKPALFESLADSDEGMDPGKFETSLIRDRIEKHRLFGEVAAEIAPVADHFGDSALYLASKFRDAVSAAYRIAKAHAPTDEKVNNLLAPVIDLMRKGALVLAPSLYKPFPTLFAHAD